MIIKILFGAFAYVTILLCDKMFNLSTGCPTAVRSRIFRLAIVQDFLVILKVLKLMIIQGYSFSGVVEEVRSGGLMTKLYVATSVVLHGALLLDEATNHHLRLTPNLYLPPDLPEYVAFKTRNNKWKSRLR